MTFIVFRYNSIEFLLSFVRLLLVMGLFFSLCAGGCRYIPSERVCVLSSANVTCSDKGLRVSENLGYKCFNYSIFSMFE